MVLVVGSVGRNIRRRTRLRRRRKGNQVCRVPEKLGGCLAHKESSKSPFLPTFLPSPRSACSSSWLLSKERRFVLRPVSSLFPHPFVSASFALTLFFTALQHANARTKRNCSRGPPFSLAFLPVSPSSLRLFGQIWFTNEIRSDIPIASCPPAPLSLFRRLVSLV